MDQVATKTEATELIPFGIQELRPAKIAELKQCCDEMVIGPDGEGYEEVKVVHIRARKIKTRIKDKHKDLKSDALKECQALDDKKRNMNALIDPIIDTLSAKRKVWDDKVAAIEEEKERKERERIQERVDALQKYDCSMPFFEVAAMVDSEFDSVLDNTKIHYEIKQRDKAEEERKQKEKDEAERKAKEKEEKRLADERAELERTRKEQAEKEATLKVEQDNINAAKKALEDEKRKAAEQEESKKAEAEKAARSEALKPDKEKLIAWMDSIHEIKEPELTSNIAIDIFETAADEIANVLFRTKNIIHENF